MRPIDLIVLHHSASEAADHTWEEIRQWHLARGFATIGYHFGVVFDSNQWLVKPGRPVAEVGAHAKGFNAHSIGVCFEGNFERDTMPPAQFDLGVGLVTQLVRGYGVALDAVKMHRALPYPTLCPGKNFPYDDMIAAVRKNLS